MNLLANACLYPGFLSFIQHIVAVDEEDVGDLDSLRMGGEWAMEYAESTRVQVHRVALSPAFYGMKFREAAEVLYKEVGECWKTHIPTQRRGQQERYSSNR